jgi:hypothetical protein
LPRKTDSKNPADWLLIVESDMELLRQVRRMNGVLRCAGAGSPSW